MINIFCRGYAVLSNVITLQGFVLSWRLDILEYRLDLAPHFTIQPQGSLREISSVYCTRVITELSPRLSSVRGVPIMWHPVYSYVNIASVINFSSNGYSIYGFFYFKVWREYRRQKDLQFNLSLCHIDYDHVINTYTECIGYLQYLYTQLTFY